MTDMLFQDRAYSAGDLPAWRKLGIAVRTLRNPLWLLADRLHLVRHVVYTTRGGSRFVARAATTDVNEAVVVLSGREYPAAVLGIGGREQPVVVDCGAHIGTFSLFVHTVNPSARLFILEPLPENAELLGRNLALNGIADATILRCALSGESGVRVLERDDHHHFDAGHLSSRPAGSSRGVTVETVTLHELLASQSLQAIDLMKLDIEGSEFDVVEASLGDLARAVRRLVMEYHSDVRRDGRNELVDALVGRGDFRLIYESKHILGFHNGRFA
jgi:FkbM family methyltransferase